MILYGQTSSGKTYTLFGDHYEKLNKSQDSIIPELEKYLETISDSKFSNKKENILKKEKTNKKSSNILESNNFKLKNEREGIIPRYLKELFLETERFKDDKETSFCFEYSFFEIYKEKVYDLLHQTFDYIDDGNGKFKRITKHLNLREHKNNQVIIGRVNISY